MATTTSTTGHLRSNVPSKRVLNAVNPVVTAILRSPFHRILSGSLLILTFTGRRTGRAYTFPVGYARVGETIVLFTDRAWRRNLAGQEGAPVTLCIQGHQRTGTAMLVEDPGATASMLERLIARDGPKAAGRLVGSSLGDTTPPTHAHLAEAMSGHALISVTLDR